MFHRNAFRLLLEMVVVAGMTLSWLWWGNRAVTISNYTVSSPSLPQAFDGFRIAQISDLHNTEIGKDNKKLTALLREAQPDIIVVTGDLVDSRKTDLDIALRFMKEAAAIAPCYYVTGNHEGRLPEYDVLEQGMTGLGVTVLHDESILLRRMNGAIMLIGAKDAEGSAVSQIIGEKICQAKKDGLFTVLLSHRPERVHTFSQQGADLIFSGHAHGGQVRLPLLGGLFAPGQGIFPKYDAGVYQVEKTSLVVSRGIGNSSFPLRINNRPEVVVVQLKSEQLPGNR